MLKDSRFVSGRRFGDAVKFLEIRLPVLGLDIEKRVFQ
jgi:hypothetical protein